QGVGAQQPAVLPNGSESSKATHRRPPQESPVKSDAFTGCMYKKPFQNPLRLGAGCCWARTYVDRPGVLKRLLNRRPHRTGRPNDRPAPFPPARLAAATECPTPPATAPAPHSVPARTGGGLAA